MAFHQYAQFNLLSTKNYCFLGLLPGTESDPFVPLGVIAEGFVEPGTTILLLPSVLFGTTGFGVAGVTAGSVLPGFALGVVVLLPGVTVLLPAGLVVVPFGYTPVELGVPLGMVPFGVTPGDVPGVCAFVLLMVRAKSKLVATIANFFIKFKFGFF